MAFFAKVLEILDTSMETPECYGWFHILWLAIVLAASILLCIHGKHHSEKTVRAVVFGTALVVAVLEVYKQINYTFSYADGIITADYQWYAFPWQFCSTPMYVGLLAGLTRKGKVHNALCAYLATFSVFAGLAVMVYPGDVFISTIGINIQTMICHGSMVVIGAYLLGSGYVKLEHKTLLKAIPVFACTIGIAVILNEIAHVSGLLETETFNMFFISPYCEPSLPVYSLVQQVIPFPLSLMVYILGFSAAAYLMLLIPMAVRQLCVRRIPVNATV